MASPPWHLDCSLPALGGLERSPRHGGLPACAAGRTREDGRHPAPPFVPFPSCSASGQAAPGARRGQEHTAGGLVRPEVEEQALMRWSDHSRLTGMVYEAIAVCREAAATGIPLDEITAMRAERARQTQRPPGARPRVRQSAPAASGAGTRGPRPRRAWGTPPPRIVIVGGGLAGLRCAHQLRQQVGWRTTVYDAAPRVGGRVETLRHFFAQGQVVEQYAEFISSEHTAVLALADTLGLPLASAPDVAPQGPMNTYWFRGGPYTQAQLNAEWQAFGWSLFHTAVQQMPWPTRATRVNRPAAIATDRTSVTAWIDAHVPGGLTSAFGQLCYAAVLSEYGGAPDQQSALNLVYLLGYDDSARDHGFQPRQAPVLAGTDEKYHIQGGNDQLIAGIVAQLPPGTLQVGQPLVALQDNGNRTYTCTFQRGAATVDVVADHVVLALPFPMLRQVDLRKANLSPIKRRAIQQLSLGTNVKIQLQFQRRLWQADGFTGTSYADNGVASGYECAHDDAGRPGILIHGPAGTQGQELAARYALHTAAGAAPGRMVADILAAWEPLFPGVTAAYNGRAWYTNGNLHPFLGGAWSYYRVGQYTGLSGVEGVQEGNIHFAGEHTAPHFQGFMEGAVRSGERVAREIARSHRMA
jgi:monoamine oxidase